jgi:hypothetical protein
MPSRAIQYDTPLHKLLEKTHDYTMLRVFGCDCWPNMRPYNQRNLNFRTKRCTFIGYSSAHKGYKYLDHTTGRLYISRVVMFDESIFPFAEQALKNPKDPQDSHHPVILPVLAKNIRYTENSLINPQHSGLFELVLDNDNRGASHSVSNANEDIICDSVDRAGGNVVASEGETKNQVRSGGSESGQQNNEEHENAEVHQSENQPSSSKPVV